MQIIPQSSGIFIPANKKGLFIVAFEKILLDRFNIIPTFEKTKNGNPCEVKFMHKKKGLQQFHINNAGQFKNAKVRTRLTRFYV